jgi:hypothetical protein
MLSPSPATTAVVLLFTWENDVGHYELVMYQKVIALPHKQTFVQQLDVLHDDYIAGMAAEPRRHRGGARLVTQLRLCGPLSISCRSGSLAIAAAVAVCR